MSKKKIEYAADDLTGQLKDAIKVHLVDNCEPLPGGAHELIAIDPPWNYDLRENDKTHRNRCKYPPMKDEEIAAMKVGELAAPDSYCFLWTTAGHLPVAFDILEGWNFTYKATHVWRKVTKDGQKVRIGAGHYGRNCLEFILVGTRGKPGTLMKHGITSMPNVFDGVDCQADGYILPNRAMEYLDFLVSILWTGSDYMFDAPPTPIHSEKPEAYYDRLEIIRKHIKPGGANAIELFARNKRPGWTVWGAEVGKKIEVVR